MKGYRRPDGTIGVRNHVGVIFTVECAHHVANCIAEGVDGAEVFGFAGCYSDAYGFRMLVELGKHPNVASVLLIRLGCESTDVDALQQQISLTGKRVELLSIQEAGGTLKSIESGRRLIHEMVTEAKAVPTESMTWRDVVVAIECGGSDFTSGLSANPATGWAADYLVDEGARVIFSELPELLGCQTYLLERAQSEDVRNKLVSGVTRAQRLGNRLHSFAISEGNRQGGLTTIEEKSLGALCKAGTRPIRDVLRTAQKPVDSGLYLLDKVGDVEGDQLTHYEINDSDGLVSLIASGAHLILFTTGRGSVVGSIVAPVIKICGNPLTCDRMMDDFDVNASGILKGLASIQQVGQEIVEQVRGVAHGKKTKSERLGHKEYSIPYKPGRACDVS